MIKEDGLQAGEMAELAVSAVGEQRPEFGTADPMQKAWWGGACL